MSSSNSPCAACKIQRRKCTQDCVFAPYFPPDQPQKFANVHKVFGASNVSKILQELSASQREDAVNSLAYEAEARLKDPVYGCVGLISILQHRLRQVQGDLLIAKKELASYIGPQAMYPIFQAQQPTQPGPPAFVPSQHHNPSSSTSSFFPYNVVSPTLGLQTGGGPSTSGQLVIREPNQQQQQSIQSQFQQQQQFLEAQQLAAAIAVREQQQQEMLRISLEQKVAAPATALHHQTPVLTHQHFPQQQPQERFNSGFDPCVVAGGPVTATGFNQPNVATVMPPSLTLGAFDGAYHVESQQPEVHHHHSHHLHHHQQSEVLEEQLLLQERPLQLGPLSKIDDEEGKSVGPSC